MTPAQRLLWRARVSCIIAYLTAFATAGLVIAWAPTAAPFWLVALADAAGTVTIFGFSVRHDNSSLYDAYWSVAPMAMAGWWLYDAGHATPRKLIVLLLVCAWGIRLTYNWARHWKGMDHEDWRYVDLRAKTKGAYWLVSFAGLHFFPTAVVMAACASICQVMYGSTPLGWLDAVAVTITAGAIVIEAVADQQLHRFVSQNDDASRILDTGLWAWSRHPNYFGETSFWWGLCLFALAAHPDAWWCAIGPAAISLMFVLVSIPMIDARMLAKRPHYREHMRRVPALLLRPPRAG